MKIITRRLTVLSSALGLSLMLTSVLADQPSIDEQATQITKKYLLTDTHIDVPYRLHSTWADVTASPSDVETRIRLPTLRMRKRFDVFSSEGLFLPALWQPMNSLSGGVFF